MSPNVNNFVHDLVEMARALEAEPRYREQIANCELMVRQQGEVIQSRELRIIDLKNELDAANERIRSLEVERDNAQFHGLELEEQLAGYRAFIGAFRMEADQLARKGTGEVSGEAVTEPSHGFTVVIDIPLLDGSLTAKPDDGADGEDTSANVPTDGVEATKDASLASSEDQREVDPTVTSPSGPAVGSTESTTHSAESGHSEGFPTALTAPAAPSEGVSDHGGQSEGPFAHTEPTTSPPAPTGDAEKNTDAASPTRPSEAGEDWFPPSRASHYS